MFLDFFDKGLNLSFLLMGLTRFTNPAPTYLNREIKAYVVLGRKMFVCWSILAKATLCQIDENIVGLPKTGGKTLPCIVLKQSTFRLRKGLRDNRTAARKEIDWFDVF